MNKTARFKIDINPYSVRHHYALYHRERRWFRDHWAAVDSFETREEARARYELVKDLPEYLP